MIRRRRPDDEKWRKRRRGVWKWPVTLCAVLALATARAAAAPSPQNESPLHPQKQGLGTLLDQRKWDVATTRDGVNELGPNQGNYKAATGLGAVRLAFSQGFIGAGRSQNSNTVISNQRINRIGNKRGNGDTVIYEGDNRAMASQRFIGTQTKEGKDADQVVGSVASLQRINRETTDHRGSRLVSTSIANQGVEQPVINLGVIRVPNIGDLKNQVSNQGIHGLTTDRMRIRLATNQEVSRLINNQGNSKLGINQRISKATSNLRVSRGATTQEADGLITNQGTNRLTGVNGLGTAQVVSRTSTNQGVSKAFIKQGTNRLVTNQRVDIVTPNQEVESALPNQGITRRVGLVADQRVNRLSSDHRVNRVVSDQGVSRDTSRQYAATLGSNVGGSTGIALGRSTARTEQTETNQVAASQGVSSPTPRSSLIPGVLAEAKFGAKTEANSAVNAATKSQVARLSQLSGGRSQRTATVPAKTTGDGKDITVASLDAISSQFSEFGRRVATTPSASKGVPISRPITVFNHLPATRLTGTTQLLTTSPSPRVGASLAEIHTSSRSSSSHPFSHTSLSTSVVAPTAIPTLVRPRAYPSHQASFSSPTQPSFKAQPTSSTPNRFLISTKTPVSQQQASPFPSSSFPSSSSSSSSSSLTPSPQRLKNSLLSTEKNRVQSITVAHPSQVSSSPHNQQFRVFVSASPKISASTAALHQSPFPVLQKPSHSFSSSSRQEPLTIVTPTLTRPGASPTPNRSHLEDVSILSRFTQTLPPSLSLSGTTGSGNSRVTSGKDKDLKRDVEGNGPNTLIQRQDIFRDEIDTNSQEFFEHGSNEHTIFRVNTASSDFSGANNPARISNNIHRANPTGPNQVVTFGNDDDNDVIFSRTIPPTSTNVNILPTGSSGHLNIGELRPVFALSSTRLDGDDNVNFRINTKPVSISSIPSRTEIGLNNNHGLPLRVNSIPNSINSLPITHGLASPIAVNDDDNDDDDKFDNGSFDNSDAVLNVPLITAARPVFVVNNAGDDITSLPSQNNAQELLVGSPNSAAVVNSNGDDEVTFTVNSNTSPSAGNSFISFSSTSGTGAIADDSGGVAFTSSSSSLSNNLGELGDLKQASPLGGSSDGISSPGRNTLGEVGATTSPISFDNTPASASNFVGVGGSIVSPAVTSIFSPVQNNDDHSDVPFGVSTVAPAIINTIPQNNGNLNAIGSSSGVHGNIGAVGVSLPTSTNSLSSGSSSSAFGTSNVVSSVSRTGIPLPTTTIGNIPSANPSSINNNFGSNPFSGLSASTNPFDRMLADLFDEDSGFRVVRPSDLGNLEQPISSLLQDLDDVAVIPLSRSTDGNFRINTGGLEGGLVGATGVPLENVFGRSLSDGPETVVGRVEGGTSSDGGVVIGQENVGGGVTIGGGGNFGFGGSDINSGTGNSGPEWAAGSSGQGQSLFVSSPITSLPFSPSISSSSSSSTSPSTDGQTIFIAPSDELMKEVMSLLNSESKAASSELEGEGIGDTPSSTPSSDDELSEDDYDEITKLLDSLDDEEEDEDKDEDEGGSTFFSTALSDIFFVKGKWIGTLLGGLIDLGKVIRERLKEENQRGY